MHPADRIRGTASEALAGTRIVLGISGSIAAVECVKLARELIRRGAEVRAVMTGAAEGIVTADSLEFATGEDVVTRLSGQVEHVTLCGEEGWGDLLLLAPATANTLAKVASGIDDTPVTSCASVALSHLPIVACPAMHGTMYDNPAVADAIETLQGFGVGVVWPVEAEDKAKLAPLDVICAHVERAVGPHDLDGTRVLVITGSTAEPLDDVRILTNVSTGRTGISIAEAAFARGADVTLWMGRRAVPAPAHLPAVRYDTVADLVDHAPDAAGYDLVVCPAAISDYRPVREEGKIASGRDRLRLDLEGTPKVLPILREHVGGRLVGFKLESGVPEMTLVERAEARMKEWGLDAIVANRLEEITPEARKVHILTPEGRDVAEGTPRTVADAILDRVVAGG